MHIPNSDKPVSFYSLDVILAVWYRTNSKVAIHFRKWASNIIKKYLTDWYTINPSRIQHNYHQFLTAVEHIKALNHDNILNSDEIVDLITVFSQTWFSIDAFDKGTREPYPQSQQIVNLQASQLYTDILHLKEQLIIRNEASQLFAQEKYPWALEGIFGNVFQSAFGQDVYPSIESKAAHLLYFVIKNHPFDDGNKRSGAFAFVRLLQKAGYNYHQSITPQALTALALLIATSDPKDKSRIIDLVILLLSQSNQNSLA